MDDHKKKIVLILCIYLYVFVVLRRKSVKRKRDKISTISGHEYTLKLLEGNNERCVELLRMSRDSFIRLCAHFRIKGWLKDSKHVSVEEKMAIFLMMIGRNQRFAEVKHMFQHSTQTIHKYFHEVLGKMLPFACEVIVPSTFNSDPDTAANHTSLRRVFKGAIGVLDGVLIDAVVPADEQNVYRRFDGRCYQNVLAVCDFDMVFTFIVAGWEGSVHDYRLLCETLADPRMKFPYPDSDKYYLCDTAYKHTCGFMTPYREARHELGDFQHRRAINDKEKFNHAHAQVRSIIDRAVGVLKARFSILKKMAPYTLIVQRDVTIACFAIHNFIRKEGLSDEFFQEYDRTEMLPDYENVQEDDRDNKDDKDEGDKGDDKDEANGEGQGDDKDGAEYEDQGYDEDGRDDEDSDDEDDEDSDDDNEVQSCAAEEQYMVNLRAEITRELMQNGGIVL